MSTLHDEVIKVTYKTVSVERRDNIASPLHYGTCPRDSLLARSKPVLQPREFPPVLSIRWMLCRVKESADSPVGIGGGVLRFSRRA